MADNTKYYYLKLKENFFDSNEMIYLESMPDGYIYSNILLKMYLRSLSGHGRLMLNERIPYNSKMLSDIVRQPIGVVEKAIKIFINLELIDVLDNGAIYILDIQNFIGKSTTEADRKRQYRKTIEAEKKKLAGQMSEQMSDKYPPEIEREIELETEPKKELEIGKHTSGKEKQPKHKYGQYKNVLLSDDELSKLKDEFPGDWKQRIERLSEYMRSTGKPYKDHLATIRSWARRDKPKMVRQQKQYIVNGTRMTGEERLKYEHDKWEGVTGL